MTDEIEDDVTTSKRTRGTRISRDNESREMETMSRDEKLAHIRTHFGTGGKKPMVGIIPQEWLPKGMKGAWMRRMTNGKIDDANLNDLKSYHLYRFAKKADIPQFASLIPGQQDMDSDLILLKDCVYMIRDDYIHEEMNNLIINQTLEESLRMDKLDRNGVVSVVSTPNVKGIYSSGDVDQGQRDAAANFVNY